MSEEKLIIYLIFLDSTKLSEPREAKNRVASETCKSSLRVASITVLSIL